MNTSTRIVNAIRGRRGEPFSSVELLECALRGGHARVVGGVLFWDYHGEGGRGLARDYLAAMRREEREFAAMPLVVDDEEEGKVAS